MEGLEVIKQRIHELILEILQSIADDYLIENRNLLVVNLDSINVIRLIFKLQESFEVSFDVHEINFDNFSSVATLTDLIANKKKLQSVAF